MSLIAAIQMPSASLLRRVRKVEAVTPAFGKPDPYATLIACWAAYMRVDDRDLGSRGMKLAGDAQVDRDVHEQQYLADLKIGEAVNAMVDSLTVEFRWAIYRSQGISTAWRFQNANYAEVLEGARNDLEQKLKKNVATRLYFS